MKQAVESETIEVAIVKKTPGKIKHKSERTHKTIFAPALSEGAFISTKIKLRTPKTTARYSNNTESNNSKNAGPKVSAPARLIREPQFNERRVLRVKSSKVRFAPSILTKGSDTV